MWNGVSLVIPEFQLQSKAEDNILSSENNTEVRVLPRLTERCHFKASSTTRNHYKRGHCTLRDCQHLGKSILSKLLIREGKWSAA